MMDNENEASLFAPDTDLYAVLGISEDASPSEVRSAYRKLALAVHPDKVKAEERDSAHGKFQEVAFAFAVLSDDTRRKRYDETGNTNETVFDDSFDWKSFFKEQYQDVVSPDAVNKFRAEYQGSVQERDAVLDAFKSSKGSLDGVFENVMVSDVIEDEQRFRRIIDEAITNGEVKAFKSYTQESEKSKKSRRQRAVAEATEAEEYAKELGVHDVIFRKGCDGPPAKVARAKSKQSAGKDDTGALESLIRSRNSNRLDDLARHLESKYGGGAGSAGSAGQKRKRKASSSAAEPTEEEFLATQTRLGAGNRKKRSKGAKNAE